MTPIAFQFLVLAAWLATVGVVVADVLGTGTLDERLRTAKAARSAGIVAACKASPVQGVLRITMLVGYLASLACTGAFVPGSRWVFLACSAAWSTLSYLDGPHILPRPVIPFYDAALLLNGSVLALCFFSPLSERFAG